MSFRTQALLTDDNELHRRVAACAAREGLPDPMGWTQQRIWVLSAQPGWDAAYASALVGGNAAPGASEAAITDGMILSAVQAIRASNISDNNPTGAREV